MDAFIKTPEQQKLAAQIQALQPTFQQREPELDALGSFPHENIQDLKNIQYHTLTLPAEYGGQGLGLYEYILAQEAISKASGPTGLSIGWHVGIVLEFAENRHWHPESAKWLMKQIASGALINTAATENNAGSPARGALPRTTAVRDGDEWIINGEKTYTSLAPALDYIFVTAALETEEVMTFIIPREAEGVSIDETWDMLAMRGTASHTLVLQNVRIPASYVLKPSGAQAAGKGWLLHIPACYIGIAAAARDYAIDFASSYAPASLGKPIAETPNIRQTIGEMELELATARHMLYGTVERYELAPDKSTMDEALDVAKIAVTHAAMGIVDKAMKIVGSRALSEANPMHRHYLNIRAGLYNPPMEDMVKAQLASKAIEFFKTKNGGESIT
ncbi:acyl-CoA dehydrogenase family protein [Planomicrobium chinense]|uniref:acyl-CoA dehydrogenase family protein n=1 Tax=Planococcus chinensis TaxID=272917 RepID=UPI001CC3ADC7|nr:acyl-CoA dehydrogenase family protein [Planococcus chinensis]MBZ5200829.1 acyl-CoA dehydrogenase family protein [Planococcus chinensis]MCP2035825.1 alkylation response protein AidB-like acyl-CoA dehydrogenase [Planomicrobium sp. HSC-17F08]